jgi:hypothetical protein
MAEEQAPPVPPREALLDSCDWGEADGFCHEPAAALALDPVPPAAWLPVCQRHYRQASAEGYETAALPRAAGDRS